mmetsp:Transcript_4328/g.13213  ORF Transcript_4328/g.13213 Transcript_4328/m.13213 type:complete len:387 (-) Transcript_4328:88-1248(-)|eukprot:CAMPEP_0174247620 /NCGR_PEP_ID=MMETSP0417-20130205/42666_1 /TAXON_ID=242541 /ORGANISM="Mayorella sp, Strain BSH-02190019" /LENGTH=386 /DNA_ID=CAMNT_0015327479 /DNA_START=40 /DNA_END=1200 /DNA_ORIENTATION=-
MQSALSFSTEVDTFETPDVDLPTGIISQADSYKVPAELTSEELVTEASASIHLATAKFGGSAVNSSSADFSDSVLSSGTGLVPNTPLILPASLRRYETPLQRFERLRAEAQELEQYLQQNPGDLGSMHKTSEAVPITALVEDLEHVQTTLHRLLASSSTTQAVPAAAAAPPNDALAAAAGKPLSRTLREQLQLIESTSAAEVAVAAHSRPASQPSTGVSMAQYAQLEKKIAQLESQVGASSTASDLQTTIQDLQRTVATLDPQFVQKAEAHCTHLVERLDEGEGPTVVQLNKIDALHETMCSCDAVSEALPLVVSRLTSLQDLHEREARFAADLDQLSALGEAIAHRLQSEKAERAQLQETFAKNAETIAANIATLEAKLNQIGVE